jgi:hypothetical protein
LTAPSPKNATATWSVPRVRALRPRPTVAGSPIVRSRASFSGMCTTALISQIVDVCWGGSPDAGATACADLYTGNAAAMTCLFGCMVTPWTSSLTRSHRDRPNQISGATRLAGSVSFCPERAFDHGHET